jgi:hypothetical protein
LIKIPLAKACFTLKIVLGGKKTPETPLLAKDLGTK